MLEQWEEGHLDGENPNVTAIANAQARGQVMIIRQLLDLTAENLDEGIAQND